MQTRLSDYIVTFLHFIPSLNETEMWSMIQRSPLRLINSDLAHNSLTNSFFTFSWLQKIFHNGELLVDCHMQMYHQKMESKLITAVVAYRRAIWETVHKYNHNN